MCHENLPFSFHNKKWQFQVTHPNTSFGGIRANNQMKRLTHVPGMQCPIKVSACCHRQEAHLSLSLNCTALYQAFRSKTPKSVPRTACPRERVLCCSVTKSGPTLCDSVNCSMPGFSVHHYLFEFAQAHVHRVGDAIQPPHLLLSPSPPAFNLSQHQGLFH